MRGKSILTDQIGNSISKGQPIEGIPLEASQQQVVYFDFEAYLNHSLEKTIMETGTKILIIDNLTYLRSETEKARNALPLMKYLKTLKTKYGLSILALAHTPKRDLTKPITRNDLQGSKMLINFVDSSFSIGESQQDKRFSIFLCSHWGIVRYTVNVNTRFKLSFRNGIN